MGNLGVYDACMFIAIVPLLAFLIGLVVYAVTANAKTAEIARCFMWCGLLVTLAVAAHYTVSFAAH